MQKQHHYNLTVKWTGNTGTGTSDYKGYKRNHTISIANKIDILASSDAPFMGDISKHNPEDLFLASISTCHMLWYLHLCADAGIIVVDYIDNATGILQQNENGSGQFTEVTLQPTVTITNAQQINAANELHEKANQYCFIANSCNFKICHQPTCKV